MGELDRIRKELEQAERQIQDTTDACFKILRDIKQDLNMYQTEHKRVTLTRIQDTAKAICEAAGITFTGFGDVIAPEDEYTGEWRVKICSSGEGRYDASTSGRTLYFSRSGALIKFEMGWGT